MVMVMGGGGGEGGGWRQIKHIINYRYKIIIKMMMMMMMMILQVVLLPVLLLVAGICHAGRVSSRERQSERLYFSDQERHKTVDNPPPGDVIKRQCRTVAGPVGV